MIAVRIALSILILLALTGSAVTLKAGNVTSITGAGAYQVCIPAVYNKNSVETLSKDGNILYCGDANEDGEINMTDLILIERMMLELTPQTDSADANIDGRLNIGDILLIEKIMLGLVQPILIAKETPTPTSELRSITLTDNDLPRPPIQGMTFHFITPAQGEPGTGKLQATYGLLSWSVWFGLTDGKLWAYHLPKRESLPASLQSFYDYLGIDEYTVYTEEDGKYWFTSIPPWLNISQRDPDIAQMPALVSIESTERQVTINYIIQ
jgi:hypothetical protein